MTKYNKGKRHDQRTILPPRCCWTSTGEMTVVSGFTQTVELFCPQPGILITEYGAYCREHYGELIKSLDEDGLDAM